MKKNSLKKSWIASRFAKKEKPLMINASNKRDDTKFERIKPTVLSNSNWIITDLKSGLEEVDSFIEKAKETEIEGK